MTLCDSQTAFREISLPGFDTTSLRPEISQAENTRNHRQRLRERFMRAGTIALQDYEMLELVLFRAIPRRDVKPLAKTLLHHFGDFNRVISARPSLLAEIQGVGDAVIQELKIVEAAAHSLAQARVLHRDVLASWGALMTYCKTVMAHRETEQFRILFLDKKNVLIADEEPAKRHCRSRPCLSPRSRQTRFGTQCQRGYSGPQPPFRKSRPFAGRYRYDHPDRKCTNGDWRYPCTITL